MGELNASLADLRYAAEQLNAWHEDCATTFTDSLRAIDDSVEGGWAASSKDSMTALSTRWQRQHQVLLDQVLRHSLGFSSASFEFHTTDEDSGREISKDPNGSSRLNL